MKECGGRIKGMALGMRLIRTETRIKVNSRTTNHTAKASTNGQTAKSTMANGCKERRTASEYGRASRMKVI